MTSRSQTSTSNLLQPTSENIAAMAMAPSGMDSANQGSYIRDEEKLPVFLVKLWNIVEDPTYYDVIRWDDSGYSFHILDPYQFCRNVLPQYFKHNNLNSLVRQLNMYGFRKITPIERSSLARAESDQDHLEFSHPCFVREHPELLIQIKRKQGGGHRREEVIAPPARDLTQVLSEVQQLRENHRIMEARITDLTRENSCITQEMKQMKSTYLRQQQIVNKLVQFLVTLVQPKRLAKRHLLAIDDQSSPAKRRRSGNEYVSSSQPNTSSAQPSQSLQTVQHNQMNEILDSLIQEISNEYHRKGSVSFLNREGPIISDVTDEFDTIAPPPEDFIAPVDQGNAYSNDATPPGGYGGNAASYPGPNTIAPPQSRSCPPREYAVYRPTPASAGQQRQVNPVVYANQQPLSPDPMLAGPPLGDMNHGIPFTSADFADYLSGVDQGIDNCRDLIGDHWNQFDMDTGESPPEAYTVYPASHHDIMVYPDDASSTAIPPEALNSSYGGSDVGSACNLNPPLAEDSKLR